MQRMILYHLINLYTIRKKNTSPLHNLFECGCIGRVFQGENLW